VALFHRKQPDPEPAASAAPPTPSLFAGGEAAPGRAGDSERARRAEQVQLEIDLLDWREQLAAQVVEQFAGLPLPVAGYIAEFQLDRAALLGRSDAERLISDAPELSVEVREADPRQVRQWPRYRPRYRGHFDEDVVYEPGDVVIAEASTATGSGMTWKVF
jgi:hypothetical protein